MAAIATIGISPGVRQTSRHPPSKPVMDCGSAGRRGASEGKSLTKTCNARPSPAVASATATNTRRQPNTSAAKLRGAVAASVPITLSA
jgi:hypothetical protein